jgi:uncharacterized protein GlcG (DUF336 family)
VSGRSLRLAGTCAAVLALASCSGGSNVGNDNAVDPTAPVSVTCDGQCANANTFLTVDDVKKVMAQAVAEAQARGVNATIAVTDRVGNVLGVYRMGDPATRVVTIATELDANGNAVVQTGLEDISAPTADAPVNLDQLAAISKAVTGSYLSSEGNAFSTRTANTIVQENFPPGARNQPGGPLFGVQFSQLRCSDTINRPLNDGSVATVGPQSAPLGLSADPGGFPLYKGGTPVGGVGVLADGLYSIDKVFNDTQRDNDLDEIIAWAATFGFGAREDIRADQSAVINGISLRYSDADDRDLMSNPANAALFDTIPASVGSVIAVTGYTPAIIKRGTAFGQPESGVRSDADQFYPGRDAFLLVDANNVNRFPPSAGQDAAVLNGVQPLQPEEVQTLIGEALGVANIARAGIRFQGVQAVRVNISMVDSLGNIIGHAKTDDPPLFGSEVSLQKARAAALLSSPTGGQYLNSLPPARYLTTKGSLNIDRTVNLGDYVTAYQTFVNNPMAFQGETAFTNRAMGNLARPFFPDGIGGSGIAGPFSKPSGDWSVFSSGLQLDLAINGILAHVLFAAGVPGLTDVGVGCAGMDLSLATGATQTQPGVFRAAGGIQIFAGSSPVYRTGPNGEDVLVGALGISGDGIDQDDMVHFLGVDRASRILAATSSNPPRHATPTIRADALTPSGSVLATAPTRYVQCPQKPFLATDDQRVCEGK